MKIFPRIFRSNNVQTVYLRYDGEIVPEIKLQPMEKYLIPHDKMRIDEEERYPFFAMKKERDGIYSYEYAFQNEQKYSIRIRLGEDIVNSSVYALDNDLLDLRPFKGDTHIHTTRSDGKKPPLETACDYRAAGYDFIAITDHHEYAPSIEAQNEISSRTDEFTVFRGEEVHNCEYQKS